MPNWCSNKLEVSGDAKELKTFLEKYDAGQKDDLFMQHFHPLPQEIEDYPMKEFTPLDDEKKAIFFENKMIMSRVDKEGNVEAEFEEAKAERIKKHGALNWYDWRIKNWGTKWDAASILELEREDEYFVVVYDTAWSPNIAFFNILCEQYPKLRFILEFEETGCWFAGKCEWAEGMLESDTEYDMDSLNFSYNEDGVTLHFLGDEQSDEIEHSVTVINGQYDDALEADETGDVDNEEEMEKYCKDKFGF